MEILVSSQQIYDLSEGVMHIDISSRDDFYHASWAFLLHDINKLQQFNLVFDLFWSKHIKVMIELSGGREQQHEKTAWIHGEGKIISLEKHAIAVNYDNKDELLALETPEIEVKPLYSPVEILYRKDFGDLNKDEMREVKALIKRIVWQLGQKRTLRKIRAVKKTSNLDLLEREIGRLRRSATRLIWLNPLAGSPDYQPLVGGIQSVLP